jgi:hypothetical protein
MSPEVLSALLVAAVSLAVGLPRLARVPPGRVAGWAERHDVPLTEATAPLVAGYLRRTRALRALGAIAGSLAAVGATALGVDVGSLVWLCAGYLVGAAAAELGQAPLPADGAPAASLVPREPRDYVPGWALLALRALAVGVPAAAAAVFALPPRPVTEAVSDGALTGPPGALSSVALAALAVLPAVAVHLLTRRILDRPQPPAAPDLVAADDAARATSIHAITGIGLLLAAIATSSTLNQLGDRVAGWAHGALVAASLVAALAGLWVWLFLAQPVAPWSVRRRRLAASRS